VLQIAGTLTGGTLVGGAEPSPSPSPSVLEIPPEDQTSPGFLGFIVTFGVAVVVILLAFSLVRHLRVVERNARRREAEEQDGAVEQDGAGSGVPAAAAPAVVHPAATGDPAAALAAAEAGAPAAEEPGVLAPDDEGVLPSDLASADAAPSDTAPSDTAPSDTAPSDPAPTAAPSAEDGDPADGER
jgi:hypothetical protein